jgi:hypothetical protein
MWHRIELFAQGKNPMSNPKIEISMFVVFVAGLAAVVLFA